MSDPDELEIGMPMELVLDPLTIDEDGNQVVTYAFAPKADADSNANQNGDHS